MLPYALKNKKPATVQITYILKFRINGTGKKDKRTADSVPLGPWGPGLASRPWGLSRLGPQAGPGAEGAGEDMPANQPPSPVDMDFLFPSA